MESQAYKTPIPLLYVKIQNIYQGSQQRVLPSIDDLKVNWAQK
jgi:hypothetical protein